MKCAMLIEKGKFESKNVDEPQLKPGEVKIKIILTGICGSEVHAFKGTHPYRIPPVILGHELVGEVVEITSKVKNLKIGDRVTVMPQISCMECEYCKMGDINLCESKRVLGTKDWIGSFAEFIVAPEGVVYKIPDNLSNKEAVIIEPLAVAVHAVRKARIGIGESCVIFGAGTIGLMTILCAKAAGATNIIVTDVFDYNLEIAKKLGSTHILNASKVNVVDEIKKITKNKGLDTAFITAGVPTVMKNSLKSVKKKGRIITIGLFEAPVDIEMWKIICSELNVIGSLMYNEDDFKIAIDLLSKKILNVIPLVTHEFSIMEVQKAFELIISKEQENVLKTILHF